MKNILIRRIDYLNFEDGETFRSTRTIRATYSTVAKLSLSLYIYREIDYGDSISISSRNATARILKFRTRNFNLNISKDSSYHNLIDYQFSSNLELVYYA
jgi:hypothetical protein